MEKKNKFTAPKNNQKEADTSAKLPNVSVNLEFLKRRAKI